MIKVIESTGKTRDDAVAAAMRSLTEINPDIKESDVDVELLERGKSGFFGIGSVDARVRVTYTFPPELTAKKFLEGLLERMGINGYVTVETAEGGNINLNVTGDNMGVVIGRRGDTLNALQYITSIVVNRAIEDHVRVTVDTEGYRKKREEALNALAHKVAARVLKYKKNVTLEPMNANERRVIHAALQDMSGISTYSMGSEPNRRVVVGMAGSRQSGRFSRNGERRQSRQPAKSETPVSPPKPTEIPSFNSDK